MKVLGEQGKPNQQGQKSKPSERGVRTQGDSQDRAQASASVIDHPSMVWVSQGRCAGNGWASRFTEYCFTLFSSSPLLEPLLPP